MPAAPIQRRTAIPGPRSRAMVAEEAELLAPGSQRLWQLAGLAMAGGRGATLEDVDGNTFVDLAAGLCVAALGYGHPRQAAMLAEAGLMVGSYTTAARLRLLRRIAATTPAGAALTRTQLYSGGAEAVESALRLARAATGRFEVVSFWGGFHGKTAGVLGLMGSSFKHGLGPHLPGLHTVPYADCSRCPLGATYPSCGLGCVELAERAIAQQSAGRVAAVVVEPIQGTAGNIVPPDDWLPAIAEVARRQGALLVADEMITGFGRSGRMFGVEHSGVAPDIMTLGKSLGGGYPVTALVTRDDLAGARPWSQPSFSSSSYGGNPMAAAAADCALATIAEEDLAGRAQRLGARLRAGLDALAERHPFVVNVRGRGLMLGFDLVGEGGRPMHEPACRALFAAALTRGVISMTYTARVRINPPLVIDEAEADAALEVLHLACDEVAASSVWRHAA